MAAQDHSHHAHTPNSTNQRRVLLAFVLTFSFMLLELMGGLWSGSLALIADAGHMLTDASALALAWLAFVAGSRQADHRRTFGYLRFEVLASLVNGLTLFAIAIWISVEAWQRIQAPPDILTGPMLLIALAGLLVNLVVFRILTHGDASEHLNMQGAVLHVLGDLLGSVAAIVAAVTIYFTGWTVADPLLSVLVSLLILRSAWVLVSRSLHILLEGAPDSISPETVEHYLLEQIPQLESVSHIHLWQITSGSTLATLHARPRDNAQAYEVSKAVERALAVKFDINHATVAIDWQEHPQNSCSLSDRAEPSHKH